nr:MAG TPA: hypothetical protein [Caudoviricetes sp.]
MQTKFNIGDKVKILDGSQINGYIGAWTPVMNIAVGEIVTIDQIRITDKGVGYLTEEIPFIFDERGLEFTDDEDDKETEPDDNLLFLAAIFAGLL